MFTYIIYLQALVSRVLLIVWQFAQPLLFGLIGAAMDLDFITPSLVGKYMDMQECTVSIISLEHINLNVLDLMQSRDMYVTVMYHNYYVTTGRGISLIVAGLVMRVLVSFFVVLGNGFTFKEKLFVAIAWLPKATVQVGKLYVN